MTTDNRSSYQTEWSVLQNQFDSYEKFSLIIKLTNVIVTLLLLFALHAGLWAVMFAVLLWLQDGIWKTWQSRINRRLLEVENALNSELPDVTGPLQFNQSWLAARPGVAAMVKEYGRSALAPTVAYPHVLLVAISVWIGCFSL